MRKAKLEVLRARFGRSALAAAAAFALCGVAAPAWSLGLPTKVLKQPAVVDLGVAPMGSTKTVTIGFAVRNAAALDALIASLSDPASPSFRQFLTPAQFTAQFGQSADTIAQMVAYLQSYGFNVLNVHSNNLMITASGTNAQIAAAFGTTVHSYTQGSLSYEAPSTAAVVPAQFSGLVSVVAGLSNKPMLVSHATSLPMDGALAGDASAPMATPNAAAAATGVPGSYTVADLAAKYNVTSLYGKGYTGAGKTIGIVTLAGYNQADAYAYWAALGLNVNPDRIVDVLVDGGALPTDGPTSNGAVETSLDVEQSGGLAPQANIRVYIGPNSSNGTFADTFAQAIEENLVDALSVSWGESEIFLADSDIALFHPIFQQAAVQGIPLTAASGDAAAFDINEYGAGFSYPDCSITLTVDHPAADQYVLAAGGTTLPFSSQHKYGVVSVPVERAWGYDYFKNYIVTYYGVNLYNLEYLPGGGGGGVSVNFAMPSWQAGLPGVAKTAAAQTLVCDNAVTGAGTQILALLPPNATGRNLPDVALNADPSSGYLIYFNGGILQSYGGTSFVAPQLTGLFALISQGIAPTTANPHGRIGFPAPQLYSAFKAQGYAATSPFKAITAGDNNYYAATATYNPAVGLGSLDFNALATTLGAVAP